MNNLKILLKGVAFTIFLTLISASVTAASETSFSGGGIIRDGQGSDAKKISFSTDILIDEDGQNAGFLQFIFHDLDDVFDLDNSRFVASEFSEVSILTASLEYPDDHFFIRIRAQGRLDGEEGWSVLARFTDFGPPNRAGVETGNARDALRIMLFAPTGGEAWYDTALDYPREQSWRTLLDGGNVTVHFEHVYAVEEITAPVTGQVK
jgi:hypothetical protein